MTTRPVILTGGGTAGHITPLLAVAKELHARYPDAPLIYVGQRGDVNESVVVNSGIPLTIKRIFAGKYRRYPTHTWFDRIFNLKRHTLNLRDVLYTTIGFIQSLGFILRTNPQAIFLKGGFVGVPVGFAGGLLRKKIITHDSDVIPGLANRLVSVFVKNHAVATDANYPYLKDKIAVVGIPVRDEYYSYAESGGKLRARQELGFKKSDQILFIGGSTQGARKIDDIIEKIVPSLLKENSNLQVIQVFGRLNEETVAHRYVNLDDSLRPRLHLRGFLHDNYKYMAAADVLIGRAGATYLAEAAVLSSACIIIPAPQLSGGHQVENARALSDKGAAKVIEEANLEELNLTKTIKELLESAEKRKMLGEKLHALERTDAASAIVQLIMN